MESARGRCMRCAQPAQRRANGHRCSMMRLAHKLPSGQIFCEANQIVEFMPCCKFNDFELFTYAERAILLGFDFSFVWIAVVLSHMDQVLYDGTGSATGSGT